jgi:hypothetical protein
MRKQLKLVAILLALFTLSSCQKEQRVLDSQHGQLLTKSNSDSDRKLDYQIQLAYSDNGESYTFPNGLQVQKYDSIYVLGGDVIIPKKIVDSLNNITPQRSAVHTVFNGLWHNGIVYYIIASNLENSQRVTQAINIFEQSTGLVFLPRTNQADYIKFVSDDPDRTFTEGVGRTGGRQKINLATWAAYEDAAHEIGHAIGLYHEHARQDRDDFVDILWNNIPSYLLSNFQKYNVANGADFGDFDYNSIMIYPSLVRINDTQTTVITKKDGSYIYPNYTLSIGDIAGIKYLYGPPYGKCVTTVGSFEEYSGGGLDTYSSVLNNVLYFYSDKEMTLPITTSTPRLIQVACETRVTLNGGAQVDITEDLMNIVIPPGTTSYVLPDSSYEYRAEYGYLVYEKRVSYIFKGAGF